MKDEREIARRCAAKEKEAFEELYRQYSPRLLQLCRRYCDGPLEAEDTLHDAFVRILEASRKFKYRGEGSLYAWMRRITLNECFKSFRKRRAIRAGLSETTDISELPAEYPGGDPSGVPPEELTRMVRELPEGYRTVFLLYAVDGLGHKEIGRLLGIKEKSSSSNLARARAILTKKIKAYNENN